MDGQLASVCANELAQIQASTVPNGPQALLRSTPGKPCVICTAVGAAQSSKNSVFIQHSGTPKMEHLDRNSTIDNKRKNTGSQKVGAALRANGGI